MALSGTVTTNSWDGRHYILSWSATQSIANNTSTISWTLSAAGGSAYWYMERTLNVVIAGSTVYSKTNAVERYAGTVTSGSLTVAHDSSGNKSFSISIQAAVYYAAVNCTGSGSFRLNNIPRKSTLTVGNGTLGTAQTLTISKKAASFTSTIVAQCGSESVTVCNKSTSTSVSFTPPLAWSSQNTTGTSVSITYTLTTYNGASSIGSNSYTKTCSIPASVKPTASISVSDAGGYSETFGGYVQSKSKATVSVSASGSYGSAIKSRITSIDGGTYTAASFTTGAIKGSGVLTISTVVTDSRGRTGTASTTISVLAYDFPKVSSLDVYRSDASGNASSSGTYLTAKFSSDITALNGKNTATYTIQYKKSTETTYTSATLTGYANNFAVTDGLYTFPADVSSSYNVELTATDAFGGVKAIGTGGTVSKLFSVLSKGRGIAFGKIAEMENTFDVEFNAVFRDNLTQGSVKNSILSTDTSGTLVAAAFDDFAPGIQFENPSGMDYTNVWKFPNGLMIVTKTVYLDKVAINTQLEGYCVSQARSLGSIPKFAERPYLTASVFGYDGQLIWVANLSYGNEDDKTAVLPNIRLASNYSRTGDFYVNIQAVGRWK